MREPFHEKLWVDLTDAERDLRGRQVSRQSVALRKQQERAKATKKKLKEEEEVITRALHEASDAAETGREQRLVSCIDVLRGHVVQTIRTDTHEVIGSRAASREELLEHEGALMTPN